MLSIEKLIYDYFFFGLDLTGRRKRYFFIFSFWRFSNRFEKDIMRKAPIFITAIKSSH